MTVQLRKPVASSGPARRTERLSESGQEKLALIQPRIPNTGTKLTAWVERVGAGVLCCAEQSEYYPEGSPRVAPAVRILINGKSDPNTGSGSTGGRLTDKRPHVDVVTRKVMVKVKAGDRIEVIEPNSQRSFRLLVSGAPGSALRLVRLTP